MSVLLESSNVSDIGAKLENSLPGENSHQVNVFIQKQFSNLVLESDLVVDIDSTGSFENLPETKGLVLSGTSVDVFLLTYDAGERESKVNTQFSATFDKSILGVIASDEVLHSTDVVFGLTYNSDVTERGSLESNDQMSISEDRKTISGNLCLGDFPKIDQIRVIVEA